MERLALNIFYFFLYSALGWLVESIYCSVAAKKWINRGFLTGPMCPIYGTGAMVMTLCLSSLKAMDIAIPIFGYRLKITVVLVILAGMVLCDIVEFITSVLMEKLFHARWWDYSNKPFNIQGRICLGHTMYWGLATLGFLYLVHPIVAGLIAHIPQQTIYVIVAAVLLVFTADYINAIRAAMDVKEMIEKLRTLVEKLKTYGGSLRPIYDEARELESGYRTRLAFWRSGRYRKQKGEKSEENLLRRARRSRAGRLIFGYPALSADAGQRLAELNLILDELENRLFQDGEDTEMY